MRDEPETVTIVTEDKQSTVIATEKTPPPWRRASLPTRTIRNTTPMPSHTQKDSQRRRVTPAASLNTATQVTQQLTVYVACLLGACLSRRLLTCT